MRWLFLVPLLLLACTVQENLERTVDDAAAEKDALIAQLKGQVDTLNDKITEIAGNETIEQVKKRIGQQDAALDSLSGELQACEASLEDAEERAGELEQKVAVLQGWVDACQETLDTLG